MKVITRKILESGLVSKHVAILMEKWGQLETGASDLVGRRQVTEDSLQSFVEEIGNLLEAEPIIPETKLEMPSVTGNAGMYRDEDFHYFYAARDEMGHLIIGSDIPIERGKIIFEVWENTTNTGQGTIWTVDDIVDLYHEDTIIARQVTLR